MDPEGQMEDEPVQSVTRVKTGAPVSKPHSQLLRLTAPEAGSTGC